MLMRTRNLGVVGTRGAGVIAHTMGPYYPRVDDEDILRPANRRRQARLSTNGQPVLITGDSIVSDEENKTRATTGVKFSAFKQVGPQDGNPMEVVGLRDGENVRAVLTTDWLRPTPAHLPQRQRSVHICRAGHYRADQPVKSQPIPVRQDARARRHDRCGAARHLCRRHVLVLQPESSMQLFVVSRRIRRMDTGGSPATILTVWPRARPHSGRSC